MIDSMSDKSLKISSVKREHGKAVLTLTNGEVYYMPRAMLKERPYKCGMPFDADTFHAFIKERSYPFALEKAISLLSLQARTEHEIAASLRKNVYPEETIARVMARLHDAGYINDSDFSIQYSSTRLSRGMGTRRIRMELRRKGIDSATADHAIDNLDSEDIYLSAIKAARKAVRGKDLTNRDDRQRVMAALARRGFDYSITREAIQTLVNENSDE